MSDDLSVLEVCLLTFSLFSFSRMRPLTSGSALTYWLLSNRCWRTTDSVTNFLKMYDLHRAMARKNDQAHYMHSQYKPTLIEINERDWGHPGSSPCRASPQQPGLNSSLQPFAASHLPSLFGRDTGLVEKKKKDSDKIFLFFTACFWPAVHGQEIVD